MRLAALEALGSAGDAAAVATLVEAAAAGGEAKRVAQRSLLHVPGENVDQQLFELIDKARSRFASQPSMRSPDAVSRPPCSRC